MRASLTLICQGETAASRGSYFPCNDPLKAREWQRAHQLQSRVAHRRHVWISPKIVAQQTVAALPLQGTPVMELAEPDYGIWAGRPIREAMMQDADAFLAWLEGDPPPGGGSRTQLLACYGRWPAKHVDTPGRYGVIAPASTIRVMILNVLGAPFHSFARIDVHLLSITELCSDGRRWNFCLLRDDIKGGCSTVSR